mmetsp:Transcript_155001/g.495649  ORF Transcript_155001/g.495649 Transcript_155001/m.495649 type:complete len:231 (-) Transcript_155001:12-704(-)
MTKIEVARPRRRQRGSEAHCSPRWEGLLRQHQAKHPPAGSKSLHDARCCVARHHTLHEVAATDLSPTARVCLESFRTLASALRGSHARGLAFGLRLRDGALHGCRRLRHQLDCSLERRGVGDGHHTLLRWLRLGALAELERLRATQQQQQRRRCADCPHGDCSDRPPGAGTGSWAKCEACTRNRTSCEAHLMGYNIGSEWRTGSCDQDESEKRRGKWRAGFHGLLQSYRG